MKFCIETRSCIPCFHFQFYKYNLFSTTVGMNKAGVFCSIQMLYPEENLGTSDGLTLWDAFLFVVPGVDNLQGFTDFFSQTGIKKTHLQGITLHNLFADTLGHAFILEVGNDTNYLTPADDRILVMANFPNHQFIGHNYMDVYGVVAERYQSAYSGYSTRCSIIFDPADKAV